MAFPFVSIIVIGYNESENLDRSFMAIKNMNYPCEKIEIIYVDSGSQDNSVKIAEKYTDKIYIENCFPSPARNRNRGILEANYDIVHFIDGDIQIDPEYLTNAVKMIQKKDIHAVYGYLEELSKKGINKILLNHWKDKKVGLSNATGAGGTFLKNCLITVDGYDERIVRGEETELGERFRSAGYGIYYMDVKMGIHNYGIHSIMDYFQTVVSDGKSKAVNYLISQNGHFFNMNNRRLINLYIQNFIFFIVIYISVYTKNYIIILLLILIYLLFLFFRYLILEKIRDFEKLLYFIMINLSKPICFAGAITTLLKYTVSKKKFPPKMRLGKIVTYNS